MAARRTIRTVTAAALSKALTDLSTVKDELGITGNALDARLTRYIEEASAAAQQFCNRIFAVEGVKDQIWPTRDPVPSVVPGGEDPLLLSTWPIVSVASVFENGETLNVGVDYQIDAENGQLVRIDANGYPKRWPAFAIEVNYEAGYDPLPADVQGKIVRMVTARYYAAGRDPSLMSESIPGVREYRIWVPTGSDAGNLPPDVEDVLNNYRVPVMR